MINNYTKAKEKATEIVSKMTVEERLSQLEYNSPGIERLGIKEYNWWNEAAHGVARAGIATVFPQAIGMAATFDPELIERVADAVSTEARAKYNKNILFDDYDIYRGITFWTPNINIFRDPRWGRGQETFGEDPFLTAIMGVSYIRGLQGDGEFLRSAACAKHYAVHSGPEKLRHEFDAMVNKKDLWETYLPAFEKAVEAGVAGVMGAYNRTNGEPCCAHSYLMQEVLRGMWGFKGYFVSDCGAIADISENHHYAASMKEGAALALTRGCDLNCGDAYLSLEEAYEEDLITEEDITRSAINLYTIRVLLGEFEENRPFSDISYDMLDCDEHKALNLKTAEESLVLLKNDSRFLPIADGKYKKIAIIGPNGNSTTVLEGNYNGRASEYVTVADGMRRVYKESRITVADGSMIHYGNTTRWDGFHNLTSEGKACASEADVAILCLGMDRTVEGEEMKVAEGEDDVFAFGDRQFLRLPKIQMQLAEAVCDVCDNVVVVVMCGSPVDLGDKVRNSAKAIIHGWYPGALGGLALARMIKGEFSPSGKLPLTFYRENESFPDIKDYSMKGRTYRYLEGEPLYPFGFGLGYAEFSIDNAKILSKDTACVSVRVTITNKGEMPALEKVQIYAHYTDSRTVTPNYQLCSVASVECNAGETRTVDMKIERYWLKAVLEDGSRVEPDGEITLYIGSHQPDKLSEKLSGNACVSIRV